MCWDPGGKFTQPRNINVKSRNLRASGLKSRNLEPFGGEVSKPRGGARWQLTAAGGGRRPTSTGGAS